MSGTGGVRPAASTLRSPESSSSTRTANLGYPGFFDHVLRSGRRRPGDRTFYLICLSDNWRGIIAPKLLPSLRYLVTFTIADEPALPAASYASSWSVCIPLLHLLALRLNVGEELVLVAFSAWSR